MNRFCFAVLLSSACLLNAQGPRGGRGFGADFGMGPASRTPVTGAPYSAIQTNQSQVTLADGNQITHVQQTKVFRDSVGRVRTERTPSGQDSATVITIFDPVAGVTTTLNPTNATAVQMPVHVRNADSPSSSAMRGSRTRANTQQAQAESLGTQIINGASASGTRRTSTIPAGAIGNAQPIQTIHETWVSTELKVPVMIKSTDPRFGTSLMQLTNIVRAEPDALLFQIPANYQITSRKGGPGGPRPARRSQNQ